MDILKSTFLTLCLFGFPFFPQAQAENEISSVQPIGLLPKDSVISLVPSNPAMIYIDPNKNLKALSQLQQLPPHTLYQVNQIQTPNSSPEMLDMYSMAQRQQLMVMQKDLANRQAQCIQMTGTLNCTLNQDLTAYKTGNFNFMPLYMNAMMVPQMPPPLVPMADQELMLLNSYTPSRSESYTSVLNEKINQVNRKLGGKEKDLSGCKTKPSIPINQSKLQCALKLATTSLVEGKTSGKVKNDVFILNDFSTGGITGKMWFIHSDGSLANVTSKNPIEVARGAGGFGHGNGSLKTPEGAIVTKAYRPPRAGHIKDGIELEGLEKNNSDILSRGVLLHGWNPMSTTNGCLGVSGNITVGSKKKTLGSTPHFLDELKNGLLKDGGVMIYNFTPSKAESCNTQGRT